MKLNAGIIIVTLIASLTTETTAVERKRNPKNEGTGLEDDCEITSSGEEVCKNNDSAEVDEEEWGVGKDCVDGHTSCGHWAANGECAANPTYMLESCQLSCNNCPGTNDKGVGASLKNDKEFLIHSIQEFGVEQTVTEEETELSNIRDTVSYMKNFVNADKPTHRLTEEQISLCKNEHALCSFWAILGECGINTFMNTSCGPACRSCHKIGIDEAQ